MDYWQGQMNAPIDKNWRCEVCNAYPFNLVWGLVNGECRCDICHTRYFMKNDKGEFITRPVCQLRKEYKLAAKYYFHKTLTWVDTWDDADWDQAFELLKE